MFLTILFILYTEAIKTENSDVGGRGLPVCFLYFRVFGEEMNPFINIIETSFLNKLMRYFVHHV